MERRSVGVLGRPYICSLYGTQLHTAQQLGQTLPPIPPSGSDCGDGGMAHAAMAAHAGAGRRPLRRALQSERDGAMAVDGATMDGVAVAKRLAAGVS